MLSRHSVLCRLWRVHMSSMSPVTTFSLTAPHLNTQMSPLCNSTAVVPTSPCTSTSPESRSILQKTAVSSSGLSTILMPPAVSSSLCSDAGKADKKEEWKCAESSAWCDCRY